MSRMCREKGAIKHDDRLDCLAQGVKYYTDALAISANLAIQDRLQQEWLDENEAWLTNPEQAVNQMAFGMTLQQRQKARQLKGSNQTAKWV